MPRLRKSLSEYLSKIKKPSPPQLNLHSKTVSTSTNWILGGCKHPKSASIPVGRKFNGDKTATLSDVDRFLEENFKSLYRKKFGAKEDGNVMNKECNDIDERCSNCLFDSARFRELPSDLCGSNRFFIAHGASRSLIEAALVSVSTSDDNMASSSSNSRSTRSTSDEAKNGVGLDDFITILMYSSSPYNEFKNSIQEMIQARVQHNGRVNWEFMEELLFCYLNLNDKKSYKYILRAFVDMMVVLRENSFPFSTKSVQTKIDKRKRKGRCSVNVDA